MASRLGKQLQNEETVIKYCFDKYDMDEIAIAFNGGKDSLVLLHLTFIFLQKDKARKGQKLQALYIRDSDPFNQVEEFIDACKV